MTQRWKKALSVMLCAAIITSGGLIAFAEGETEENQPELQQIDQGYGVSETVTAAIAALEDLPELGSLNEQTDADALLAQVKEARAAVEALTEEEKAALCEDAADLMNKLDELEFFFANRPVTAPEDVVTESLNIDESLTNITINGDIAEVSTKEEFIEAANNQAVKTILVKNDINMTGNDGDVINVSDKIIDLNGNTVSAKNFTLIFEGTDFTIRNGKMDSLGGSYALFIGDSPTSNVVIENITANAGINIYNSQNVILRNVDITARDYYAVWCDNGGQAQIESGTFKAKDNAVIGMAAEDTQLEIKGGNFETDGKKLVLEGTDDKGRPYREPIIYGGTFDCSAKEYVDESIKFEVSVQGQYSYYQTIDEAVSNAPSGSVIIPTDDTVDVDKAFQLTLDFNDGSGKKVALLADVSGNVVLPKPERTDGRYEFVAWKDGNTVYQAGTEITLTADMTLIAEWKKLPSDPSTPTTPNNPSTGGSSTVQQMEEREKPDPADKKAVEAYNFWKEVKAKIRSAKDGKMLKISVVQSAEYMPASVMQTLYERKNVGLTLYWNENTIVIPAGKAMPKQPMKAYWTVKKLTELY